MSADVVLVVPPLALLLLAALACAWLARGDVARRQRQAQVADALRPRHEMGPFPHGPSVDRGARSPRPIWARHSVTERSPR